MLHIFRCLSFFLATFEFCVCVYVDFHSTVAASLTIQAEHLANTSKCSNDGYNTLYMQQFMPLAWPPTLFYLSVKCNWNTLAPSNSQRTEKKHTKK